MLAWTQIHKIRHTLDSYLWKRLRIHLIPEKSCPAPIQNVNTTCSTGGSDFLVNDVMNCTCDVGFIRASGDYSRICLHDTTLSGSQLQCTGEFFSTEFHRNFSVEFYWYGMHFIVRLHTFVLIIWCKVVFGPWDLWHVKVSGLIKPWLKVNTVKSSIKIECNTSWRTCLRIKVYLPICDVANLQSDLHHILPTTKG